MTTVTVTSESELIDAIQQYGEGDTIISEDGQGRYSGATPADTTLDGEGVVVVCDRPVTHLIALDKPNITLRNVEFRGNRYGEVQENGYWDYPDGADAWDYSAEGVGLLHSDVTVENCTFSGWTHAAIKVGVNNADTSDYIDGDGDVRPTIRDCDIVDNNCRGLGYGVASYSGFPTIEWCYFNNNRHDIAGGDWEGCGYEARYNHFGDTGRLYGAEMHPPGGRTVNVHHNTFEDKIGNHPDWGEGTRRTLIVNRGVPTQQCYVENNWFKGAMTTSFPEGGDSMYTFQNNHEGADEPADNIGQPRDTGPETYTLDIDLTDTDGNPIADGEVEIRRME